MKYKKTFIEIAYKKEDIINAHLYNKYIIVFLNQNSYLGSISQATPTPVSYDL